MIDAAGQTPVAVFAERVRHLLDYDPATGAFTWRFSRRGISAGPAGCVHPTSGYVFLTIDDGRYYGHRVAWLYVHGHWPPQQIDHINRDRADNRISNLRSVSPGVNNQNRVKQSNNRCGLLGVSTMGSRQKGFRARVHVDGECHFIGVFDTPSEASEAYIRAKRDLHEGCTV